MAKKVHGLRISHKAFYTAYKLEMRWLKNKIRKLKKHLKRLPNDNCAVKALAYAESGKLTKPKHR